MKATGLVLKSRAYRTSVEPPDALEDESRFGNDGTFDGDPIWVRLPSGLWVLDYDGNDSINIPHSTTLNVFPITIMAWIRGTVSGVTLGIVVKYAAANGYAIFGTNGYLNGWYYVDGANRAVSTTGVGTRIDDGVWHLCTGVVNSVGMSLYVDAALVQSDAWIGAAGVTTTAQPLLIGRYAAAYHTGYIWRPRIYNYALSPTAIYKHFQAERSLFGV